MRAQSCTHPLYPAGVEDILTGSVGNCESRTSLGRTECPLIEGDPSMPKIISHLWFPENAREAVDFYVSTIPNSAISGSTTVPAETPSGPPGSVTVIEFRLGDQNFTALEAGRLRQPGRARPHLGGLPRQWRPSGALRLAEGPLGPVLADRSPRPRRDDLGCEPRKSEARDGSHACHGKVRYRRTRAGTPRLALTAPRSRLRGCRVAPQGLLSRPVSHRLARDEEKCVRFSARIPRLNFLELITFMLSGRPDPKAS